MTADDIGSPAYAMAAELCGLTAEFLGADRVLLWRPSPGATELVVRAGDPVPRRGQLLALSLDREESRDASVLAFRAARPVIQNMPPRSGSEARLFEDLDEGEVSVAAWPILEGEQAVGVLACYWHGARALSGSDVTALDRLSRLFARVAPPATVATAGAAPDPSLQVTQAKLLSILASSQRNVAGQIAQAVANQLDCAVVIADSSRQILASAGRPSLVATVRESIASTAGKDLVVPTLFASIPSSTVAEPGAQPYGWIVTSAQIQRGGDEVLRSSAHALSAYWSWTSNQPLVANAVAPLMLLAVLQGDAGRPRLETAYGLFELEPTRELSLTVLDCVTPENAFRVSGRARSLQDSGVEVVTAVAEGELVTVLLKGSPPADLATVIEHTLPGVRSHGSSATSRGLETLAERRDEALLALEVGRAMGRSVGFDELGRSVVLFQRLAGDGAREFVDGLLMPLRTTPGPGQLSLFDVAAAYIEQGFREDAAAEALGLDSDVLARALERISELSGLELARPDDAGLLAMAINWDIIARGL